MYSQQIYRNIVKICFSIHITYFALFDENYIFWGQSIKYWIFWVLEVNIFVGSSYELLWAVKNFNWVARSNWQHVFFKGVKSHSSIHQSLVPTHENGWGWTTLKTVMLWSNTHNHHLLTSWQQSLLASSQKITREVAQNNPSKACQLFESLNK